jgi:hypothetical protein
MVYNGPIRKRRSSMKKIKITAVFLALALIMAALSACGEEEKKDTKPAPKEPAKLSEDMKITVVAGGEVILPKLPEGYKITQKNSREEVKATILSGEQDMAVVSPTTAAELYEESEGAVLTLSPVKMGGISILYYGYDKEEMTPGDLSGRNIVTAEEGEVSQIILDQAIREDEGYSVVYKNVESQKEVADALKEYNTYALVTEPYASKIMEEDGNVKKIMDLDALWKAKDHGDVPTGVIVTRKWKTEENQNDMKVFMKDYREAAKKDENRDKSLVFYGRTNRGDSVVREFFREILELDKNAMGGKMPPEEMFYRMSFPT